MAEHCNCFHAEISDPMLHFDVIRVPLNCFRLVAFGVVRSKVVLARSDLENRGKNMLPKVKRNSYPIDILMDKEW